MQERAKTRPSSVENVTLEGKDKLGIRAKLGRSRLHDRFNPNGFHTNKTAVVRINSPHRAKASAHAALSDLQALPPAVQKAGRKEHGSDDQLAA